jgi:hypothetical protein
MKQLNKLTISPEKLIKNDELINLQGGYNNGWCCLCITSPMQYIYGVQSEYQCWIDCRDAFGGWPDWGC